jgi:hypothetical protein
LDFLEVYKHQQAYINIGKIHSPIIAPAESLSDVTVVVGRTDADHDTLYVTIASPQDGFLYRSGQRIIWQEILSDLLKIDIHKFD